MIKRAVFHVLTLLRAATIKEFDTFAWLETPAIDANNDAPHYRDGDLPLLVGCSFIDGSPQSIFVHCRADLAEKHNVFR